MNSTRYANMLSNHPDMVQAVPAMPMDNSAWNGSNSLGNVVDIAPDVNNRQMVLKLDEWGPPEMWTISLAIDRPATFPDAWPYIPYFEITAEILFGSGGATQTVEVDWISGQQLSLPMNACNVTAVYDYYTYEGTPPTALSDLRLSAMLARGTAHSRYAPKRTVRFINQSLWAAAFVDKADFQCYRIPPFTEEVEITWPRTDAAGNPFALSPSAYLVFGDGLGMGPGGWYLQTVIHIVPVTMLTYSGYKITIPSGCRYMGIRSQGALENYDLFYALCHLGV